MTQQPERDESGRYHIDGSAYRSVTTIIGEELDQPALDNWMKRTDNAEYKRDYAGKVGDLAHRRILNPLAVRTLPVETVPEKFQSKQLTTDVEVAEALWEDVRDQIPISEQPYIEHTLWSSDAGGYAGTADMITNNVLVDLKTSGHIWKSHKLQASAYTFAARQRDVAQVDRAAIVKVDPDEPASKVKWLSFEQLEALYEEFKSHVESFNAQTRLGEL